MRPEHWVFTIPLRLRSLFRCSSFSEGQVVSAVGSHHVAEVRWTGPIT